MSYLTSYLSGKMINTVVDRIESIFIPDQLGFDTIAVTGNSGMLLGPTLAARWDKNLIIIRKNTEGSHSDNKVEGWGKEQKILIVDDFIGSGQTLQNIYDELMIYCDTPIIKGILLWAVSDPYPIKHTYDFGNVIVPIWKIEREE